MNQIVKPITKEKFKAYVGLTKLPYAELFCQEIAWFSNEQESILGVILFDYTDFDFNAVLLGRDEIKRFRAFDLQCDFKTPNAAILWLCTRIEDLSQQGRIDFPQGDCKQTEKVDLFEDVVSIEKQHPYYRILKNNKSWISAKKLISEIMPHFKDIDGNFIEQFQSTGFDQRLWELYLFNYFKEEKLDINKSKNIPDFLLSLGNETIGVEAVTISRKTELSNFVNVFANDNPSFSFIPNEKMLKNDMPLMWGSSLISKLNHEVKRNPLDKNDKTKIHYWELDYLKDKPFIIAIQDFHDDYCMTWSQNSLIEYLYGYRHQALYINEKLKIIPQKIISFDKKGKAIPAGFFFQPLAENVSVIIATPLGTLSKFNRLGKQAGFDIYNSMMLRVGLCHRNDSNATKPNFFQYFVNENSHETWVEGISVFHNPNALHPLNKNFFPNAAHHHFNNGQIISTMPEFLPYNSYTFNMSFIET